MLTLKESLKHYKTTELRKALSNYNKSVKISGYSKLSRSDLENLIVLNSSKFQHLILEKAPEEKKKVKKPMEKKEEVKKEVMKPMEKKEEEKLDFTEKKNLLSQFNQLFEYDSNLPSSYVYNKYLNLNDVARKAVFDSLKRYYESIQDNYMKWTKGVLLNDDLKTYSENENDIKTVESEIKTNQSFKTKKALEKGRIKNQELKTKLILLKDRKNRLQNRIDEYTKNIGIVKNLTFYTDKDFKIFNDIRQSEKSKLI